VSVNARQPRRAWGSLESDTMAVLWAAAGPLTSGQVQAALAEAHGVDAGADAAGRARGGGALAYNTVQTILIRLLDKGLVSRRAAGRGHVYWPTSDAATAAAAQMRAVLDGPGDRQAVLQHFADGLDAADIDALRALLDRDDGGSPG
jgi:predicted transcriptional regulator